MCTVSVILPVYNSEKYVREALDSVLRQTYQDWELLAIVESGTTDDSAKIIEEYAKRDRRIRLIQNKKKLGLADSLNKGFRLAEGKYLARLDADDLAAPQRFEKQVRCLEKHPNVGILGTYQHHIGKDTDWVHKPPVLPKQCRAGMLFGCDLCHSTLMLRKSTVMRHKLFYDHSYLAEDYELWLRALHVTDIANIPEVLGTYRVGEDNITNAKKEKLSIESGYLVARTLKRSLGYTVPKNRIWFFRGWENPFLAYSLPEREKYYREFEHILRQIIRANKKAGFYDEYELLRVIDAKWRWAKYGTGWNEKREIRGICDVFSKPDPAAAGRALVKRMLRVPYEMIRRRTVDVLLRQMWETEGNLHRNLGGKLDESTDSLSAGIDAAEVRLRQDMDTLMRHMEVKLREAGQTLMQSVDGRIWKAEQDITQSVDGRIWKAEQDITQSVDGRIWKAEQDITQNVDTRIWKAEKNMISVQKMLAELLFCFGQPGKKLVMINTPSHDNLGDHAIAYAEQLWAARLDSFHYIEISGELYRQCRPIIRRFVTGDDVIAISGGGFLGTLWPSEEELALQVIADFPENKIRIFPQTVFFSEDETGRQALEQAYDVLKSHKALVIFTRESFSYHFMETQMPQCRTVLACDMALYLFMGSLCRTLGLAWETGADAEENRDNGNRGGILLCLKQDRESELSSDGRERLGRMLSGIGKTVSVTDMLLEHEISAGDREREIRKKIAEFEMYETVVTDRFHGIVFSLLARTRCIVLGGVSYKNKGLCEMLSDVGGVTFARDLEEVCGFVRDGGDWDDAGMGRLMEEIRNGFEDMAEYF